MVLDHKLAAGDIVVLDGAIGSEIERLGGKMDLAAWCGVANVTHPDTVRRVHEAYLEAGADVITANTFATCRHVLEAAGYGGETVAVNRRAVELAQEARDRVAPDRPVAIAGSMSNNVAWLPGTVAPDPAHLPSPERERANYREMAETLAEAGCDLLIMEMLQDVEHATRVMEAAVATGLPVWAGISTSRGADGEMTGWNQSEEEEDHRLPDGHEQPAPEPLRAIIDAICALGPTAVGIMHSSLPCTTPGLEILFERWSGPVMAYPEATGVDVVRREARGVDPVDFAEHCRGWVESGVQIIGGCCGTTIHHIRAMVDRLPERPGIRPAVVLQR
ncbi:MAG: homocysteine S-methyltransferase family protein [Pseudomonadales bacterium]|nr:homocysteine S-methyltransferase family protein [Pseudomonadales bacterium]